MNEENKFQDGEEYSVNFDKNKLSFKDIVILHVKKIGDFASCEFRGGFWESRPIQNINSNQEFRVYIPDSREVYSNAVEYLSDILFPYFDRIMKQASEEAEKAIDKAFESFTIEDKEKETNDYKENRQFENIKKKVSYRTKKREINRVLFRELCSFLYRKKYLELGTIED